jgi:phosphosulfolactate phosphohydrolase-like enzyme
MEDLIGAGAVVAAISQFTNLAPGHDPGSTSDRALLARAIFDSSRDHLFETLSTAQGGRNVIDAGLRADIEFAARLDAVNVVGRVIDSPLRVVRD